MMRPATLRVEHHRSLLCSAKSSRIRKASPRAICSANNSSMASSLLLEGVRVILVSPKTPANIGAVLRVAENFEAHNVCVVDPRCDPFCEEVRIVSCGSQVLDCMTVAPSLQHALRDVSSSVGFTRRAGAGRATHISIAHLLSHYPDLLPEALVEEVLSSEESQGGEYSTERLVEGAATMGRRQGQQESSLPGNLRIAEQMVGSASRQHLPTAVPGAHSDTISSGRNSMGGNSSGSSDSHVQEHTCVATSYRNAQGAAVLQSSSSSSSSSSSTSSSSSSSNSTSKYVGQERGRLALVFGREESGLLESELLQCSHACSIPTGRSQPSLNLSHAVSIALAQLFEAKALQLGGVDLFEGERSKFVRQLALTPANQGELESLLGRWAALLESAGISTKDSTGGGDKGNHGRRKLVMGHLRSLLLRGRVNTAEVRSLHGLAKDLHSRIKQ